MDKLFAGNRGLTESTKKYLVMGGIIFMVYFSMKFISPIVSPFIIAFLLAGLLNPLVLKLHRKIKVLFMF